MVSRFALGWISDLVHDISVFFTDIFCAIIKALGVVFYIFSYLFFMIIDFLEITFKTIIGLDQAYSVKIDGSYQEVSDDLVLTIIKSKTISRIFIALSVVAVFLLIVSTIIAIIRSEYRFDKEANSKGPIFGRAIKALALYITVPVACLFGVWGASQLLKILDKATTLSNDRKYISTMIFVTCAADGNRLQSSEMWQGIGNGGNGFYQRFYQIATEGGGLAPGYFSSNDKGMVQRAIDNAFENTYGRAFYEDGSPITDASVDKEEVGYGGFSFKTGTQSADASYRYAIKGDMNDNMALALIRKSVPEGKGLICSPYRIDMVYFCYALFPGLGGVGWGYNHVLSILVSFLILKTLFDITLGVMKRAYELVVLYVISPPVVALMPLDEGKAYNTWVKSFIGKTLMAYGGVLAINFFFWLVPIFKTITIFSDTTGFLRFFGGASSAMAWFFNQLVRLLFILAGGFSLNSLSQMISNIIGAEDAAASGSQISGAVGGMVGKLGGLALGAGKALIGGTVGKAAKAGIKAADKGMTHLRGEKTADEKKKEREDKIKELAKSDDPHNKALAEQMKQTDALNKIERAGGTGGGGGGKKDDGMGDGSIANFVRKHVTGGATSKLLKSAGSLYTASFDNATGGQWSKGNEAGQKAGAVVGGVIAGAISGTAVGTVKAGAWVHEKHVEHRVKKLSTKAQDNLVASGKLSHRLDGTSTIADRQLVNDEMMRLATLPTMKLGRIRPAEGRSVRKRIIKEDAMLKEATKLAGEAAALHQSARTDTHNLDTEGNFNAAIAGAFEAAMAGASKASAKESTKKTKRVISEETKKKISESLKKRSAEEKAKSAEKAKETKEKNKKALEGELKAAIAGAFNAKTTGTTNHNARYGDKDEGQAAVNDIKVKDIIKKLDKTKGK